MVRFFKGRPIERGRAGILAAAFNPVTTAHLALAEAAQEQYHLDQVVFLLPAVLPHKQYVGAGFDDRIGMIEDSVGEEAGRAIASSEGGLFIEIARAFRAECGPGVEIYLLCGRDAADRIVHWDYGAGPPFSKQLDEYQMLVASRAGDYGIPAEYRGRIHQVRLPAAFDEVSASNVREAIAAGRPWKHMVPDAVARRIERKRLYHEM